MCDTNFVHQGGAIARVGGWGWGGPLQLLLSGWGEERGEGGRDSE